MKPEEKARLHIDEPLIGAGLVIQDPSKLGFKYQVGHG
jgi:hypothetical protein